GEGDPSSRPEREARSGETFSLRQAARREAKVFPLGTEFTPSEAEGPLDRDDGNREIAQGVRLYRITPPISRLSQLITVW
ncbi:MAG TPA: hypothetical protein VF991_06885, partial [Reyranella sp.]